MSSWCRLAFVFGLGAMAAGSLRAQVEWADSPASYICRSSNEVREIKTYVFDAPHGDPQTGLVCRVDYLKNGSTKTLWSSRSVPAYCDGVARKLAAMLGKGNFVCTPLHAALTEP